MNFLQIVLCTSCVLVACFSTGTSFSGAYAAPKVNVTVYVESGSVSTLIWYNTQLKDTLKNLSSSDILDINLIPYGNTQEEKIQGNWKYTCQFGKFDCLGTFGDACVKHYYPKFETYFPFFVCAAEYIRAQVGDGLEGCCDDQGIDYFKIKNCVDGPMGRQLMHQNALQTGTHDYVPWIIINGKHNTQAYEHFTEAVCAAYTGPKPDACKKI